jgi:type IV pilus assembly protein PilP
VRYKNLLCLLILPLLSGCGGGEHEDIKQWMDESSRDLRGRVPPLPELKPFPVISYDANDQIDPFSMSRVEPEKRDGGGGQNPTLIARVSS